MLYVHRHAVRVSPQFSNRMIDTARSVLNRYIPDIYLYSDIYKGEDSGKCVIFTFSPTFDAYKSLDLQVTPSAYLQNRQPVHYTRQKRSLHLGLHQKISL